MVSWEILVVVLIIFFCLGFYGAYREKEGIGTSFIVGGILGVGAAMIAFVALAIITGFVVSPVTTLDLNNKISEKIGNIDSQLAQCRNTTFSPVQYHSLSRPLLYDNIRKQPWSEEYTAAAGDVSDKLKAIADKDNFSAFIIYNKKGTVYSEYHDQWNDQHEVYRISYDICVMSFPDRQISGSFQVTGPVPPSEFKALAGSPAGGSFEDIDDTGIPKTAKIFSPKPQDILSYAGIT